MNTFELKLIAPDGVKYEQEATEVILPTPDGQIAVLANHEPVISVLSPGEIIVKQGNKEHFLATEGGIVEIANNLVKVLADTAEDVDSLDELKIEEAKKAAQQRLADVRNDEEYAETLAQLEKQIAKISAIKRRKKYRS
ncbi:MAG: ATP synthase epsilon chain [bacterium ADurb.Bin400]|nr:MAG: ATP synthase epsilon chain [bacterium ADurb.Bin400]